jgi:hypothetical protein|tara:strand:- start:7806 stop:7988 length:183 start_codon:yes stop_codon:yes gene_type:complete
MEIKEDGDSVILRMTASEFAKIRKSVDYIHTFYKSLDEVLLEMTEEEAGKLSDDLYSIFK